MIPRHPGLLGFLAGAGIFLSAAAPAMGPKPVPEADQEIRLFSSEAHPDGTGWKVLIRGRLYEPELDSGKRKLLVKGVAEALKFTEEEEKSPLLMERGLLLLSDGKTDKAVRIRVAGRDIVASPTDSGGVFTVEARVAPEETSGNLVKFSTLPSTANPASWHGSAQLIQSTGLSVISDLDDTVKVTNVTDRKEMMRNTLVRPFQAAPGMADLYRAWKQAKGEQIAFHLVSASPCQLQAPLEEFLGGAGFPRFSFHCRSVNISIATLSEISSDPVLFKVPTISEILGRWPQRKFVLVGDSGEKDP
ncbi:MAG: DUF2183 domain-containing protein, partial [Bdellovibrionales bacterium]|nr:DUF2183 domain-containing protein [Bdellovibrionales bacterium]